MCVETPFIDPHGNPGMASLCYTEERSGLSLELFLYTEEQCDDFRYTEDGHRHGGELFSRAVTQRSALDLALNYFFTQRTIINTEEHHCSSV